MDIDITSSVGFSRKERLANFPVLPYNILSWWPAHVHIKW